MGASCSSRDKNYVSSSLTEEEYVVAKRSLLLDGNSTAPPMDTVKGYPPSDESHQPHGSGHSRDPVKLNGEQNSGIKTAVAIFTEAVQEDRKRNYEVSLTLYQRGIDLYVNALADENESERVKTAIQGKIFSYIDRVNKLQKYLEKKEQAKDDDETSPNDNEDEDKSENLKDKIKSSIVKERPNVKWSDVAGLEEAKEVLQNALILPIKFPHLMAENRKPWRGILLFGPNGTGKSFLAQVAAAEASSHTVFSLKPYNITNKWLGEPEKLAKILFDEARLQNPSLIFFDEVDGLATHDVCKSTDSIRRMKVEFLLQMKGMDSVNDGLTILGATSKPWDLDDTLRRWFEKKIYIPLPNENARLSIFKRELRNIPNSLYEVDFKTLAEKTDGYSGNDIAVLVKEASMQPLKKLQSATHFTKVMGPSPSDPNVFVDDLLTPCSECHGAIEMSWMDIPADKLLEPLLTMDDMLNCLAKSKPSVTEEELDKMKKYLQDIGIEN